MASVAQAVEASENAGRALVITAHRLTADLARPRPAVYWADLVLGAAAGYGALALAVAVPALGLKLVAGLVSAIALYRAVLFIHELTHLTPRAVPGFWLAWNLVIGIPLLLPSFFYEGVHNLHHQKITYGTPDDPEYWPFARRPVREFVGFLLVAPLFPLVLLARSAIAAPLGAVVPAVRRAMVEYASSLSINPGFRRRAPKPAQRDQWIALEIGASVWAWGIVLLTVAGVMSLATVLTGLAVGAAIATLNQVRTLVAHRWESAGDQQDVLGQFLDTTNVPPPALLPSIWAPLGLRYHALHHMLPSLPYHSLGAAHRRLVESFPIDSPYRRAEVTSIWSALKRTAGLTDR
jgi:fatty acid desaturase